MRKEKLIVTICRMSVLALVLLTQGCVVADSSLTFPIAVGPARELGTDKHITFQDSDGQRIEKDGLLLVLRSYGGLPSPLKKTQTASIIGIHNGRATIRDRWVLASIWTDVYWYALPGIGFHVEPAVRISIVPMIPGHHVDLRETPYPKFGPLVPHYLSRPHDRVIFPYFLPWPIVSLGQPRNVGQMCSITLVESAKVPSGARAYWEHVKRELESLLPCPRCPCCACSPRRPRWRAGQDDVLRVVGIIDDEILPSLEGPPAHSQPVAAP